MKTTQNTQNSKFNIYELITNKIIEKLEAGVIPWHNPLNGGFDIAKNYVTQKPYRGINQILLDGGEYLTFKQVQSLGGKVKAGEKGKIVTFYKTSAFMSEDEDGEEFIKTIPFLRYYYVFHLSQTEGIPSKLKEQGLKDNDYIDECNQIVNNYKNKPPILNKDNAVAYYSSSEDYVNIPNINHYESSEYYYAVLFHELIHSTSHPNRLGRKKVGEAVRFGSEAYAQEELVAEMGSAFLCGLTNISKPTIDNSASYIDGWMKAIRNDNKLVIIAASAAQKAVDYIVGKEA